MTLARTLLNGGVCEARTPDEIDVLTHELIHTEQDDVRFVRVPGRLCQLRVMTVPRHGVGAVHYANSDPQCGSSGAWDSLNPDPMANAPQVWFDLEGLLSFRASSILPLDQISQAVREYCLTGGRRPSNVGWQHAQWY